MPDLRGDGCDVCVAFWTSERGRAMDAAIEARRVAEQAAVARAFELAVAEAALVAL